MMAFMEYNSNKKGSLRDNCSRNMIVFSVTPMLLLLWFSDLWSLRKGDFGESSIYKNLPCE